MCAVKNMVETKLKFLLTFDKKIKVEVEIIKVPRCDCGHTTASHHLVEEDTEELTYCKYKGCNCTGYEETKDSEEKD